ncbi:MAG: hypothetical protein LW832_02970 [Parachlamydia sp.]|jgi:hypothetical protein|nr:hypothetical protein [Parachlamydia sp.]
MTLHELQVKTGELFSLVKLFLLQDTENQTYYAPPLLQTYFDSSLVIKKQALQRSVAPPPPGEAFSQQKKAELPKAPLPEPIIQIKPEIKTENPPPAPLLPKLASKNEPKRIALEPLKETQPIDQAEWRSLFEKHFPQLPLCDQLPDDTLAKKKMSAWKEEEGIPPILLLSFTAKESHLSFLKQIAKAITLHFKPARALCGLTIEGKNEWKTLFNSSLQLVIATDTDLYLQKNLMNYYQEAIPGQHLLQNIPLLLLSDLDLYLRQPQLKPLVWRAICKELAP